MNIVFLVFSLFEIFFPACRRVKKKKHPEVSECWC